MTRESRQHAVILPTADVRLCFACRSDDGYAWLLDSQRHHRLCSVCYSKLPYAMGYTRLLLNKKRKSASGRARCTMCGHIVQIDLTLRLAVPGPLLLAWCMCWRCVPVFLVVLPILKTSTVEELHEACLGWMR